MGRSVTLTDGMESLLTSLGKKSNAREYISRVKVQKETAWRMYQNSWIAKKFIDKTAEDMVKRWRELSSDHMKPGFLAQIQQAEKKLNIKDVAEECLIWSSLYGESLILAITDVDNDTYATPLNLEKENIQRFIVIDSGAYTGKNKVEDILSSHFGKPEFYEINNNLLVHHSRIYHAVAGIKPLSKKNKGHDGLGISDLQSAYNTIAMFDTISACVSDLIEESKVDIFKQKGLNEQIAAGREEQVLKYISITNQSKSQSGAILIDADTEYEQKEISFAGLSDIWMKAGNVLAGALDRPVTVLFGQSASGFNSGEEDNKNYYDLILSLQESRLRPMLDFIDMFILDGLGEQPEALDYRFPSLDTMNKIDEANIFNTWASGISTLIQQSSLTSEMALKELKQRNIFQNITDENIEELIVLNQDNKIATDRTK